MKEKVWEYFSGHIVLKCDPYTTPNMCKTYFEQKTSWILQNVSKREEQIGKENDLLSKDKPRLYSMRSYYYISHAERSCRVASANSWISPSHMQWRYPNIQNIQEGVQVPERYTIELANCVENLTIFSNVTNQFSN